MRQRTLAIDVRGLNYLKKTGVTMYTLHMIKLLANICEKQGYDIHLVGLKDDTIDKLLHEYPWMKPLMKNIESLSEYCGLPKGLNNTLVGGFLEVLLFMLPRKWFDMLFFNVSNYDVVWMPSHKALPISTHSQLYVTIHDLFHIFVKDRMYRKIGIRENKRNIIQTLRRANVTIAVSYSTAKDIKKLYPVANTIHVAYPGPVDPGMFSPGVYKNYEADVSEAVQPYFVCLSGIEPRKNWLNCLYAHHYNILHVEGYNASLYFLGIPVDDSYYQQLQSIIKTYAIPRVIFVPNVNETEKKTYLSSACALLFPSLYEGFGFPILEAFTTNTPVITSQVSSMPELAKNAALYVNPLDIIEIANAMIIMLQDVQLRQKLIDNIPSNLAQFSWEEYRIFWEKILTNR